MRSAEEIWSLYLEGQGDQLEVDELSEISQGCQSLVKFPAWVALVKAMTGQMEAERNETMQSVAHGSVDPIRRIFMDEYTRGRIEAQHAMITLPEAWENDVKELIAEKADG